MDSATLRNQLEQVGILISEKNLDAAHKLLKKIIGAEPESPRAFNLLGVMHEKQGNFDAARRMYRVALTKEPAYYSAQNNLHRLVQMTLPISEPDLDIEIENDYLGENKL
ncbi:MAG: hypothetical protein A4E52_00269 [Pelotomaculum sp. PtaB.Bin013]|uniref:Tetratricopeptide repeat protein n=1 Tax=Pelotomaculum isophthalicicum JI TaxID=947010 RepID=A0A9X4JUA2_9FIRM|nr:tetratricopeptide repeat protein [Pelotomaculum isophthalicicum]MDF9408785.1 tetratricopeptide repeat protein [Pelotomaculum isophthalicicum JI]OPX91887.1 MAG: hypothetical protein A4E52_00269 [Pelotomaculum sp. PtaB.Bin013]